MPALVLGKLRRLTALADYDGRLQIAAATPADRGALSTQASAVLLPPADLPGAVHDLDRGAGLMVALSAEGGSGPLSLVGGWSVAKTLRCGAAGAAVRVTWPLPTGDESTGADDQLRMLGDECAKYELPLLLLVEVGDELLGDPGDALVEAVGGLSGEEHQVDLLAVRLPAELDDPVALLARIGEASAVPWLPAGGAELIDRLPAAADAGCAGYLWLGDAAADDPVYTLRRLNLDGERCRPWTAHPRWADGLAVAGAGDDWHKTY